MTDRQKAINSGEEWLKRGVPMTRHLTLMILLPIVLVICANCAGSPVRTHWQAETNNANMTKLKLGMSEDEVLGIMGSPDKTEAYTITGESWLFWLYITEGKDLLRREWGDRNYTPLGIKNGKLVGWGRNFYQQTKSRYEIELNVNTKESK